MSHHKRKFLDGEYLDILNYLRRCVRTIEVVIPSFVRGYHVYQQIWNSAIGEQLVCVAIQMTDMLWQKSTHTVGHILKKICSLFLRCGGGGTIVQ